MIAALLEADGTQSRTAGEQPLHLTREVLAALLAQREKQEKKASRQRRQRARARVERHQVQDGTAIATRSPAIEHRPGLSAPNSVPLLLSYQTHAGAHQPRQLAPLAPDDAPDRNPGID